MLKAIKEGEIDISGFKMRCYVCDDGNRYLNADDVERFFMLLGTKDFHLDEHDAMQIARFIKLGDL